jgi:hypothetical protein
MGPQRVFRATLPLAFSVAVALPSAAHAAPCDATGNWRLELRWQDRNCDPDVISGEQLTVSHAGSGLYLMRAATPASRLVHEVTDDGGVCRLTVREDVRKVLDGHGDYTRYTFTLVEQGGRVGGTATYQYLGQSLENDRGCTQQAVVSGVRTGSAAPMLATASHDAPPVDCPAGQLITVDTDGFCCWPGQVWSTRRHGCMGKPTSCPAGSHLAGESCVAHPVAQARTVRPGARHVVTKAAKRGKRGKGKRRR